MSYQKHWCFTINESADALFSREATPRDIWNPDTMDYLIFSMEKGTHVHLQGYVAFTKKIRMSGVKKALKDNTAHVEPAKGSPAQNKAYCSKLDETHLLGPWEWGTLPAGQGHRSDLDAAIADIDSGKSMTQVARDNRATFVRYYRGLSVYQSLMFPSPSWRDLSVFWIWGPSRVGKTRSVYEHDPHPYKVVMPAQWWDNYDRHQTLLLDDFYGQIPFSFMLNILDGYPLQLPIKGGFVWAHWTKVFITSNVSPSDVYKNGVPADCLLAFNKRINEVIHMH